jgi:hypothetical protein
MWDRLATVLAAVAVAIFRRRGVARWELISRCPGEMAGNCLNGPKWFANPM